MRRRSTCHLAVSSDSDIIVFHEFGLSHGWRDAVGPQNSPDVGGSDWFRHELKLALLAPRDRLGHPCPCLDDTVVADFARTRVSNDMSRAGPEIRGPTATRIRPDGAGRWAPTARSPRASRAYRVRVA